MIYYLIGVALFIFMLEQLVPGWKLPKVSTWVARVIFLNIVQVSIALLAGITWNKWMMGHSLLHTSDALPPLLAGFAAYFVNTFVTYWWHRARHANDTLWRLFHQLHHAPQRIEVFTSFYKHPTEMVFNSLLGSFVAYVVMGISIEAGAYYIMFAALGEMFYHSNLRTPHVLGYLFQRPEMHRIHHQRDRHECNYSDFPIWDMLFGTYENPAASTSRRASPATRSSSSSTCCCSATCTASPEKPSPLPSWSSPTSGERHDSRHRFPSQPEHIEIHLVWPPPRRSGPRPYLCATGNAPRRTETQVSGAAHLHARASCRSATTCST